MNPKIFSSKIHNKETFENIKPLNLENDFRYYEEIKSKDLFLHKYKGVCIDDNGMIYKGLHIFPESIYSNEKLNTYKTKLISRGGYNFFKRVRNKEGRYILFSNSMDCNCYYHWLIEALPRLCAIKDDISDATIVLENYKRRFYKDSVLNINKFIYESLEAFDFKDIVTVSKFNKFYVENLELIAGNEQMGTDLSQSLLINLQKHLLEYFLPKSDINLGDRIYISRSKAKWRKVLNENEVIELLSKYGFKAINAEEYSFTEQVSIFNNVKYLISVHGAGLSNVLFMNSGGGVMELFQPIYNNPCYQYLSVFMGLDYLYQFCKAIPPSGFVRKKKRNRYYNIEVDINKLKKDVELMLHRGF